MARPPVKSWIEARALVQRNRREYLIFKPRSDEDCPWEFPGGAIHGSESPEASLRRICRDKLGIELEIVLGQPPFAYRFGTHEVTYRYYLCSVRRGEVFPRGEGEARWVLAGQLRDYVFSAPTQDVVDWLIEELGPK